MKTNGWKFVRVALCWCVGVCLLLCTPALCAQETDVDEGVENQGDREDQEGDGGRAEEGDDTEGGGIGSYLEENLDDPKEERPNDADREAQETEDVMAQEGSDEEGNGEEGGDEEEGDKEGEDEYDARDLDRPRPSEDNAEPSKNDGTLPAGDRVVFLPRAQTLKKGEFALDMYEVLWFSTLSYGVSDDVQLTFGLSPVVSMIGLAILEPIGAYTVSVKKRLVVRPKRTLSVLIESGGVLSEDWDDGEVFVLGGAGLLYDHRLGSHVALHAGLSGGLVFGSDATQDEYLGDYANGVSLRATLGASVRVADWCSWHVETVQFGSLGKPSEGWDPVYSAGLAQTVFRFHGDTHAFDVGVAVLVAGTFEDEVSFFEGALPVLNYAGRF